ncbi:MAG: GNAT family protein [Bdellovibrionota bacterium]
MTFDPKPIRLSGDTVVLEPLDASHLTDLLAAADSDIWRYLPGPPPTTRELIEQWFHDAQQSARTGFEIPFAIVFRESGRAIGSTRYMDIQRSNSGLEIGWTWVGTDYQRTGVNTECKLLLLSHAFEDLHAVRVQLKTDGRNEKSQRAIERLGAVREGTLRKHRRLWDGFIRDSVYYSILDHEWPSIKARLLALRRS